MEVSVGEAGVEVFETAGVSSVLAQAKLIFVTKGPVSFGALRSQVISTYGQQILFWPTLAMSPLTNTVVDNTGAPSCAPVESTSWNDVPAYVPVQLMGRG